MKKYAYKFETKIYDKMKKQIISFDHKFVSDLTFDDVLKRIEVCCKHERIYIKKRGNNFREVTFTPSKTDPSLTTHRLTEIMKSC